MCAYSYDLPQDVFDTTEVRPMKPKKKVAKKLEQMAAKRSHDASELEVCDAPVSCQGTSDRAFGYIGYRLFRLLLQLQVMLIIVT